MPEPEDGWRESLEKAGAERRLVQKPAAFTVPVLDEWLPDEPGEGFCSMIPELMEAGHGASSTIFRTQCRKKDWHARLGGDVAADAIMDRIVHDTTWVDMGDFNMREKLGGRMPS